MPDWCDEAEMLVWAPLLVDPPMATLKEMQDGTYSIDDVLQMNLLIKWKQDNSQRDN